MINIQSHLKTYSVEFFENIDDSFAEEKCEDNVFIIDSNVFTLYQKQLSNFIASQKFLLIHATEQNKSYEQVNKYIIELIQKDLKKNQTLVVIGGGVIQDISCFIASIYYRGLPWKFYPTTLLAQADSCIGSKSSLNIGNYKNQIGTFYPPNQVKIVAQFLQTLQDDDINSGIGEIIKLALIDSQSTVEKTRELLSCKQRNFFMIKQLIQQSLKIKKNFIEADEFDRGIRNVLNYGHTFAHAFEVASEFAIPHGIAVLLGIQAATYVSENLGYIPENSYSELRSWTDEFVKSMYQIFKTLNLNNIIEAMKTDKKRTGPLTRFILPKNSTAGQMQIIMLDLHNVVTPLLEQFIANY